MTSPVETLGSDYTVTRYAAGSFAAGAYVPGATSSVTIRASIQPLSAFQISQLPEGHETSDAIRIYTTTELLVATKGDTAARSDRITYRDKTYEVQSVATWNQISGIAHWKCIAFLVDTI